MQAAGRPRAALAVALTAIALLLLVPIRAQLAQSAVTFACAAALAGFLVRRRVSDALVLALVHLAAAWPEEAVGVQLMAFFVLTVLAATLRPLFSAFTGAAAFGLVLGGMHLKSRFAGSVLTWHDVGYFLARFRDNIGVMKSQPSLVACGAAAGAGFVAVSALCWIFDSRLNARSTRGASRWVAVPLSIFVAVWCSQLLADEGRAVIVRGAWLWSERWQDRPISTFLSTLDISADPQLRRADTVWLRKEVGEQVGAVASAPGAAPADIVLVLQESQFNPQAIAGCPASLCRMPVFAGDAATQAQGPLRVHVFGGGTWLTEFAVNTGVPHSVFGAAGDFAPFNVAPHVRRSFVRSLRAAGYRTVAVYPTAGGMMNGRQAYEGYGFDKFYAADDLGIDGGFGTPDETMHGAALRVLEDERRHGKPVFLMVLTIFNHSEHGVAMERVPAALGRAASAVFADPQEARNVADYVWRTRAFQDSMARTTQAVLSGPRPAVLAWFGDHQPPFGRALGLRDRIGHPAGDAGFAPKFGTWYHIASNRRAAAARVPPQPLDIAFMPGLLAELAGVPADDWLAANAIARRRCGGLLVECREPGVRDAYLSFVVHELGAFSGD